MVGSSTRRIPFSLRRAICNSSSSSVGRTHWFGGQRREKARRPTMSLNQDRIQDDFRRQNDAAHKHNQRCNNHRDHSRGQCVCMCERAALWFCRLRPVCKLATGPAQSETLVCSQDARLRIFGPGIDAERRLQLSIASDNATQPEKCARLRHRQLNSVFSLSVPPGRNLNRSIS